MTIPGLHETITRLATMRRGLSGPLANEVDPQLVEFSNFGSNPGALLARSYLPADLGTSAPLVVVLHGCTQSASSYNRGAGWTSAADEHGFALLFPEQQRANNPNLCFNWFSPVDAGRGSGEALSIVQMVQDLCSRHALDPGRVYVTGLSAGGAMTAAMLATYPEVFAGGAVIAGLPFGTASTIPEAFERMREQAEFGPGELARMVRSASPHAGPWPTLSVWHGQSDRTVDASNADALVDQWRGLHGLAPTPTTSETTGGHLRRVWSDGDGNEVLEEYVIAGMGHGTPIHAAPANPGEAAGPYMLDVGLSSTRRIVHFWKLDRASLPAQVAAPELKVHAPGIPSRAALKLDPTPTQASRPRNRVQEVIETALTRAGLMR
jgi:poly(hydroxyalkanoate) depolymerase family esterase